MVIENHRSEPKCVNFTKILDKNILNYIIFLVINFHHVQCSLKSIIEQNAEVNGTKMHTPK